MPHTYGDENKKSHQKWQHSKNTGFLKYSTSPIRVQHPTEHLGCIPETFDSFGIPLPPRLSGCVPEQQQNSTSTRMAKMNHFVGAIPSSVYVPWNSFGDPMQMSKPFPLPAPPEGSCDYIAHGYSSSASHPFHEPDNSATTRAMELQLRGELRACEEEIKRLKKENPFFLVLESVELLQVTAKRRSDLAFICAHTEAECILQWAGKVLGVRLGYGTHCSGGQDRDGEHNVPIDPALLEAAAREGTTIRNRLLDHIMIEDAILEKYAATCEEMKLSDTLRQLNELLSAVEVWLQSLSSVSSDAAPNLDLSYTQLLRAAFVWKLRYQECVQRVSQAVESSCSVHVLYANALKAFLPSDSPGAEASHAQGGAPCADGPAVSKAAELPVGDMAELKQELAKMSLKARTSQLHGALHAELEHARKVHIVTEALVACQHEIEDRIQRIVRVQQILALVWDRLGDGWGHQRDGRERDQHGTSLSLLDYARRSRLDVPNNVKAAVVFDVLRALQELHFRRQVYRWLNPVNIIAQDGFKLRASSEVSSTEPLPPWRFMAPELLLLADQTSSVSSSCCKTPTNFCPNQKSASLDGQEIELRNNRESKCRTTILSSCGYGVQPGEISSKMPSSTASVGTSNPGSAVEKTVSEHETIDSACDIYSFGQVVLWLLCLNNSADCLVETLTSSMTAVPVLNRILSKDQRVRPSIDELLELEWFGEKVSQSIEVIMPISHTDDMLQQSDDKVSNDGGIPSHDFAAVEQAAQISKERTSALNKLVLSDASEAPTDVPTLRIRLEEEALMQEIEDSDLDDECGPQVPEKQAALCPRVGLESSDTRCMNFKNSDSESGSISSEIEELMQCRQTTNFSREDYLTTNGAAAGNPFGPSPNKDAIICKSVDASNEEGNLDSHDLATTNARERVDLGAHFQSATEVCSKFAKFGLGSDFPEGSYSSSSSGSEPFLTNTLGDGETDSSISFPGNDDVNGLLESVDFCQSTKASKIYHYFGVSSEENESNEKTNAQFTSDEQMTQNSCPSVSSIKEGIVTPAVHECHLPESRVNLPKADVSHHRDDSAVICRPNQFYFPAPRPEQQAESEAGKTHNAKGCFDEVPADRISNSAEVDMIEIVTAKSRQSFECHKSIEENGASSHENSNLLQLPQKHQRLSLAQLKVSNDTRKLPWSNQSSQNGSELQLGILSTKCVTRENSEVGRLSDSEHSINSHFFSNASGISSTNCDSSLTHLTSPLHARYAIDVPPHTENSNISNVSDNEQNRNRNVGSPVSSFSLSETSSTVKTTPAGAHFQRGAQFGRIRSYNQQTMPARKYGDSSHGNAHRKFLGRSSEVKEQKMENELTPALESSEKCSFVAKKLDGPDAYSQCSSRSSRVIEHKVENVSNPVFGSSEEYSYDDQLDGPDEILLILDG